MKTLLTLALFCYFLAMLKFFMHLAVRRQFFHALAVIMALIGFGLHTAGLMAISAKTGHGPYTTPFEYTSFFAWTTMAVLLVFAVFLRRIASVGAFVSPLAFLLMAYSMLLPEESGGGQVRAFWLTMHYTVSFLALSSFIVVFAASAMYLIQENELKHHRFSGLFKRMPDLDTLDLLLNRALVFGFPLISVGVLSGMIWANKLFGSLLGPKPARVLPIIVVWFVYALLMFGRTVIGWRGHTIALVGLGGFALAAMAVGFHLAVR